MPEETFTCERCGREFPRRQMKEVMYEEGRDRVKKQLCPECLDQVMNRSDEVRGIAGEEKRAAVHLDNPEGDGGGERRSFGRRSG